MHIEFLNMCDWITLPPKFVKLGDLEMFRKWSQCDSPIKGYGQSFSNLKVLVFVPSLRALRAFFISSHSDFIGGGASAPDPGAPGIGYMQESEV